MPTSSLIQLIHKYSRPIRWVFFLGLLISTIIVWQAIREESPSGRLRVIFLDVGQGDAALVISPVGNKLLIDGGPDKKVLRQISHYLPWYTRTIDLVMESHPDSDHIAGLPDVIGKYRVRGFIEPYIVSFTANNYQKSLEALTAEKTIPLLYAEEDMVIDLGGGAVVKILRAGHDHDTNSASIIARLSYGQSDFLFLGDSPKAVEKYLVYADPGDLPAEVLKVAHHGSRESTDPQFLDLVHPDYSVISVGTDNRYGHPHQEVLDLLHQASSTILRTDQVGDVVMESDGEGISYKK